MLDDMTAHVMDEFKGAAAISAVALGAPNTDTAWAEWLDVLRREAVDFRAGELSTEVRTKVLRPEPDFEVLARGLLWEPLEIFPDPDPEIVTFELGEIEDVCRASDRVCRRLADEALRIAVEAFTSAFKPTPPRPDEAGPVMKDRERKFVTNGSEVQTSQTVPPPENAAAASPANAEPADSSRTMTLKEATGALRVSDDTLHRMRKRGEIKMFRVGSRWRVLASEVIRLRQQPKFSTR
jgi:excisionase family DNA binding protein